MNDLSNEKMIHNIKMLCGTRSRSYYNIKDYETYPNQVVVTMYKTMLAREKAETLNTIAALKEQIEETKERIKEIEKMESEVNE